MRVVEVLKGMAFGAGTASLKVVGSFAFPGAWPIIEGALDPVIDRLKERLGVDDPLDEKNTQAALSLMLTDDKLVALFEEKLKVAVAPLRVSHEQLEEGERRLLQIFDGNTDILKVIQEDLDQMRTVGVSVAEPSVIAIRDAVGNEFADRIRGLEQRLDQLVVRKDAEAGRIERIRSRFRDQLARTQARAVELLNAGEFDRAADELRSGLESLQLLIEEAPGNVDLRVNLAYYYKSIAVTFASIGMDRVPESIDQAKVAEEFNERAMSIFYFVAHGIPLDRKTARDHAHAINGVGNIHYARGQYHLAIEDYELATRIDPYYCYAWHDLFAAYYSLARQGHVNFSAMRHALDKTRETGQGQPGLGAKRLEELQQMISRFDPFDR
jgi:tetratricopeptide (TPR) repeat protein